MTGREPTRLRPRRRAASPVPALILTTLLLAACAGGGGSDDSAGIGAGAVPCSGTCYYTPTALSASDVQAVIAQAVSEAGARAKPATIAVVDRVGNVLAVYQMNGAPASVTIGVPGPVSGGLEGVSLVPSTLSAIAKAVTGAYLSSEGNAFSTRTASQIVQDHFNPGEMDKPGGPLFGVQFSQLPCSDLAQRATDGTPGPHRSPLGLSADPGGLPLYKNGTVVGGVGIEADGLYTLDPVITDHDHSIDELIAVAGSYGFGAPRDIRASRITAGGVTLRYSDVDFGDLSTSPASAPAFSTLTGGSLVAVTGYVSASVSSGTAFGQTASGVVRDTDPALAALGADLLVDGSGNARYPVQASADLSTAEVKQLLVSGLTLATRTRAQIRIPLGSAMRATIAIVDTQGTILGLARSNDAPVFGTDVAVQKARASAFFSAAGAASGLRNLPNAGYLQPHSASAAELMPEIALGSYVDDLAAFLGRPTLLSDGAIAFSTRALGNISRPYFPDGIDGKSNGSLSKPAGQWSPFSDGLQLDLAYNAVIAHLAFVTGLTAGDTPRNCSGVQPLDAGLGQANALGLLANGIQIFAGGVPLYRGTTLVGAIGVSGDGINQDDLIAFLGADSAGRALSGAVGNAPAALRADQLQAGGVHLEYVQCPQAPFTDSTEQNACAGR